MTDAKEYSIGANAKFAGLEYDPGRSIDWRMGWLEERPERNRGPNIPDDWVRQTMAYRQQVLREPQDVTMNSEAIKADAESVSALATRAALILKQVMTGNKSNEVLKTAFDDLVIIDRIAKQIINAA